MDCSRNEGLSSACPDAANNQTLSYPLRHFHAVKEMIALLHTRRKRNPCNELFWQPDGITIKCSFLNADYIGCIFTWGIGRAKVLNKKGGESPRDQSVFL